MIARIPQGSAVIPDGKIVRLPTKSLVDTEAMMMTNLRWELENAVAQQGGLTMPRSLASFECNHMHTYCMHRVNMQDHKRRSFEHSQQSVDKGEAFWADGCDPRQSIS